MTSSPGFTSRSYSAPIRSNAQVSEANTIVSLLLAFQPPECGPWPAAGTRADRAPQRSGRCSSSPAKTRLRPAAGRRPSPPAACAPSTAQSGARSLRYRCWSGKSIPGSPAARELLRIDQVAVVRDANRSLVRLHQDRLRIEQRRIAGGRVARVPDGDRSRASSPTHLR